MKNPSILEKGTGNSSEPRPLEIFFTWRMMNNIISKSHHGNAWVAQFVKRPLVIF